jgi:CpeT/CpcT family (DUF1001)
MAPSRMFAVAVLLVAAVVAPAAQPKKWELMHAELTTVLGGSYDNIAQSRASTDHVALRLMVVPVQAPGVGDHVFYVQEVAADDARRVLAQRLYVLNGVPNREEVVMMQFDFNEPARWRDGQLKRDLFRGLLQQDLRARAGCEMRWVRKQPEKGGSQKGAGRKNTVGAFIGTAGGGCRAVSRDTGETVKVELRMELTADGLAIFEQQRDALGALVAGDIKDPWFRFGRRADAPW